MRCLTRAIVAVKVCCITNSACMGSCQPVKPARAFWRRMWRAMQLSCGHTCRLNLHCSTATSSLHAHPHHSDLHFQTCSFATAVTRSGTEALSFVQHRSPQLPHPLPKASLMLLICTHCTCCCGPLPLFLVRHSPTYSKVRGCNRAVECGGCRGHLNHWLKHGVEGGDC